jgi:hypothetical protein
LVEATEGCNINQGKCARQVKSTKFVKQILSTRNTLLDFKIREQFSKVQMIKALTRNFSFLNQPRNFHAKWKGGKGDVFSQENVFIALVALNFDIVSS